MRNPRFVWLAGNWQAAYPDIPEHADRGVSASLALWDRQANEVALRVSWRYSKGDTEDGWLGGLADWLNRAGPEAMRAQGVVPTMPEFRA